MRRDIFLQLFVLGPIYAANKSFYQHRGAAEGLLPTNYSLTFNQGTDSSGELLQ